MTTENKITSAHTPGPWIAEIGSNGMVWVDGGPNYCMSVCDLYSLTASGSIVSKPNAMANARLISAAPELIAACEAFSEWLSSDEHHSVNCQHQIERHERAARLVRIALNKAKGTAS